MGALLKLFQNLLICTHNWNKENTEPPKDNGRLSLTGTLRALNKIKRLLLIASLKENNSKLNKHLDKLEKGICAHEIEVKEEPLVNSSSKFCTCDSETRPTDKLPEKPPLHLFHHSHLTRYFLLFLLFPNFLFPPLLIAHFS